MGTVLAPAPYNHTVRTCSMNLTMLFHAIHTPSPPFAFSPLFLCAAPWGNPFSEQWDARSEQAVDSLVSTAPSTRAPPPALSSIWGLTDQLGSLGLGHGAIGTPTSPAGHSASRRPDASSDLAFMQGLAQGQQAAQGWADGSKQ